MKFWNIIREFFLFSWLFGHHNKSDKNQGVASSEAPIVPNGSDWPDDDGELDDLDNGRYGQSFNDFHEEQDDYDMMEDF